LLSDARLTSRTALHRVKTSRAAARLEPRRRRMVYDEPLAQIDQRLIQCRFGLKDVGPCNAALSIGQSFERKRGAGTIACPIREPRKPSTTSNRCARSAIWNLAATRSPTRRRSAGNRSRGQACTSMTARLSAISVVISGASRGADTLTSRHRSASHHRSH
jgi:hypothetical protein